LQLGSLGRSRATRGRGWNGDTGMSPAVLPAVCHRDLRRWERRGAKLPGQRLLPPRGGRDSASRRGYCQDRGGRGPGGGGRVNGGETRQTPSAKTGQRCGPAWANKRAVKPGVCEIPRRRRGTAGVEARPKPPGVLPADRGKPVVPRRPAQPEGKR
jgi:hypothetical protein